MQHEEEMVAFANNNPLFPLGKILATPESLEQIQAAQQSPDEFLRRHSLGDWGDELCADDKALNDEALKDGSRLLSAYKLRSGTKIWIITEAADDEGHREATTIILPSQY